MPLMKYEGQTLALRLVLAGDGPDGQLHAFVGVSRLDVGECYDA